MREGGRESGAAGAYVQWDMGNEREGERGDGSEGKHWKSRERERRTISRALSVLYVIPVTAQSPSIALLL